MKRERYFLIVSIIIITLTFGGIFFTGVQAEDENDIFSELGPFLRAYQAIQSRYIKEVDPSKLIEGAIKGMMESLEDPHSYWLDPRSFEDERIRREGRVGGTGMVITIEDGSLTVVSCIEETPASQAGIHPGDKIIKINGDPTEGIGLPEAADKLRGNPGTEVTVTIQREGVEEPLEFTLTRVIYKIPNVKKRLLDGNIGYLKITEFMDKNTAEDVKSALVELQNKKITGLILDLRDNPGGLFSQAVRVADEFLSSGVIVSVRGRNPSEDDVQYAHPGGTALKIPLVVLINRNSASASEIVAGAIKDHKRGILLGTRTFGKGTVQLDIPLEDKGAIHLTVAKYYTSSGKCIEGLGIEPDIRVEAFSPSEEEKEILAKLRKSKCVEEFLAKHPSWEKEDLCPLMDELSREEVYVDEELLKRVLREKDEDKENDILNDLQLRQAMEILKALEVLKGAQK